MTTVMDAGQVLEYMGQIHTAAIHLENGRGLHPGCILQAVGNLVYGPAPVAPTLPVAQVSTVVPPPEKKEKKEKKENPCSACKQLGHVSKVCPTIIETKCGCRVARSAMVLKKGVMKPHGPYTSCTIHQSGQHADRKALAALEQEGFPAARSSNANKRKAIASFGVPCDSADVAESIRAVAEDAGATALVTKAAPRKRPRTSSSSASSSNDNNNPQPVDNATLSNVFGATAEQASPAQQQQQQQPLQPVEVCITMHSENKRFVCVVPARWDDNKVGSWLSKPASKPWPRAFPFQYVIRRVPIADPRKARSQADLYTVKEVFKPQTEGLRHDLDSVRGGKWQEMLLPEKETIIDMCFLAGLCSFCHEAYSGPHKPGCAKAH